ncbi:MAG: hypothetical protein V2I63_01655 [Pseudomonadales bacterium]|jgi:hypothetical protein|nr:hypothetical protein [Pseudomonadales bacterium]
MRPQLPASCVALFLSLSCIAAEAAVLPETPPPGLRITASVACDFQDRWWEATFYPGANLPLEVRWRAPGTFGDRPREVTRPADPEMRDALYGHARGIFDGFVLRDRPLRVTPGTERPWTGDRTLNFSALVLNEGLGRVDRIDLAIDMIPGRALAAPITAFIDALAEEARQVTLELDCT